MAITAYDQAIRFVQDHGIAAVSRRYHAVTDASHQMTLSCSRCQASTEVRVDVADMPAIVELFSRKATAKDRIAAGVPNLAASAGSNPHLTGHYRE